MPGDCQGEEEEAPKHTSTCLGLGKARTFCDCIFDAPLLGTFLATSLALLAKLGKNERSHTFNHTRKDRVARVEQPRLRQSWVIEVDAALENRVFCDSEVSPKGRHGFAPSRHCSDPFPAAWTELNKIAEKDSAVV